jgi:hypothetical protein
MSEPKRLTRRQQAVIDELFTSEMQEQDVLDRHGVSAALYSRWLSDERFCEHFEQRIARAYREARRILARYAPLAAMNLVHLANCEKEETARKACLDIVAPQTPAAGTAAADATTPDLVEQLPPETATRLLAALAEIRQSHAD